MKHYPNNCIFVAHKYELIFLSGKVWSYHITGCFKKSATIEKWLTKYNGEVSLHFFGFQKSVTDILDWSCTFNLKEFCSYSLYLALKKIHCLKFIVILPILVFDPFFKVYFIIRTVFSLIAGHICQTWS